MGRNKLYALLSTACITGYIWLIVTYYRHASLASEPGVCLFKRATGIPCPSCGSTRSVLAILNGHFNEALLINPFGILILLILIVGPAWMIFDFLSRNDSFYRFYNQTEIILRRKWIAIPLILLVLLNWIWNISKGL